MKNDLHNIKCISLNSLISSNIKTLSELTFFMTWNVSFQVKLSFPIFCSVIILSLYSLMVFHRVVSIPSCLYRATITIFVIKNVFCFAQRGQKHTFFTQVAQIKARLPSSQSDEVKKLSKVKSIPLKDISTGYFCDKWSTAPRHINTNIKADQ